MSLPDSPIYPEAKALAETWHAAVERDLKGADFNKRLVTETYDGIAIQPLYGLNPKQPVENSGGMPGTSPHTRQMGHNPGSASPHIRVSWGRALESVVTYACR